MGWIEIGDLGCFCDPVTVSKSVGQDPVLILTVDLQIDSGCAIDCYVFGGQDRAEAQACYTKVLLRTDSSGSVEFNAGNRIQAGRGQCHWLFSSDEPNIFKISYRVGRDPPKEQHFVFLIISRGINSITV